MIQEAGLLFSSFGHVLIYKILGIKDVLEDWNDDFYFWSALLNSRS